MKEVKRIAKVGERIKVINDEDWELSGIDKNPYPICSEWEVKKVLVENSIPPGTVFCNGNNYGLGFGKYVVLDN